MPISPEKALEVLQRYPGDPIAKEYFEAVLNGELPQYYLDKFQFFQMCSDDLPGKRLVDMWHPDYPMMKCRGNAIVGISVSLQGAVKDEVIKDDRVINQISTYVNFRWNFQKGFKGQYWTSPEEISLINKTLEVTINCLKNEHSLKNNTDIVKARFQEILDKARSGY